MDDKIFWEMKYSENLIGFDGAQIEFDEARIILRYNTKIGIWQNFYYVGLNGSWHDAEPHEIADILLIYTDEQVDEFLKNEAEKINAKNESLEIAKHRLLSSATIEPGKKESAA